MNFRLIFNPVIVMRVINAPFPISCIVTSLNNSKVLDRLQRNFVHIINTLAVVHLRLIFNPISFMRAMPLFQFPVFFLSGQLSNAEWISMKLGKQVMISLLGNGALALDFSIWPFWWSYVPFQNSRIVTSLNNSKVLDGFQCNLVNKSVCWAIVHVSIPSFSLELCTFFKFSVLCYGYLMHGYLMACMGI